MQNNAGGCYDVLGHRPHLMTSEQRSWVHFLQPSIVRLIGCCVLSIHVKASKFCLSMCQLFELAALFQSRHLICNCKGSWRYFNFRINSIKHMLKIEISRGSERNWTPWCSRRGATEFSVWSLTFQSDYHTVFHITQEKPYIHFPANDHSTFYHM